MGAPAGRVSGLARLWAGAGHDVHILTGFPNHPTGRIHADYRAAFRRGYLREDFHGVSVHRTWVLPAANRGVSMRSLNYLSFMLSAAVASFRVPRPDVVIATSPQLLCAACGLIVARRFHAPLVMEVRDLWPESLVAVGASSRQSPIVSGLEALARRLYRSAARIVTVTDAQRAAILGTGIAADKVHVIPNGVDEEWFGSNGLPSEPEGPFVVTYIGTLGMAHKLETLLDAASALRDDFSIRFRIIGEGAERGRLEAYARERALRNVEFLGEVPRGSVASHICASHVCAVLLRSTPTFLTVVPSKMLEIMAVGRPILLGVAGEAAGLLERARAGLAIEPENVGELVSAIRLLREDHSRRRLYGENGRSFVRREFQRSTLAARYLHILESIVQPGAALHAASQVPDREAVPQTVTESQ